MSITTMKLNEELYITFKNNKNLNLQTKHNKMFKLCYTHLQNCNRTDNESNQ